MLNLITSEVIWRNIVHQWGSYGSQRTSVLICFWWSLSTSIHEKINVVQWGSYRPHMSSLLNVFVKFVLSGLNSGMNIPCWSWSQVELFEKNPCWCWSPIRLIEEICSYNEADVSLIGYPYNFLIWSLSVMGW